MHIRQVELNRGWQWLVEGLDLLFKQPGQLLLMGLAWSFAGWLLAMIPFLGSLAALLLGPVMLGGLLYSARRAAADQPLEFSHLFQGFQEDGKTISLITLGLLPLGVYLIRTILVFAMSGLGMIALAQLLGLVAVVCAGAIVALSVPQIMFEERDATSSIQRSIGAVTKNPGALGLFTLILMLGSILIVGTLTKMLLGILVPVFGGLMAAFASCGIYLAYQEVLGSSGNNVHSSQSEIPASPDQNTPDSASGDEEEST